jgi:hypothetical protein
MGGVAGFSACAARESESLSETQQPLAPGIGQQKWPTDPVDNLVHIPVCFKTEAVRDFLPDGGLKYRNPEGGPLPLAPIGPQYAQEWVRNAVERSWNVVSNVRFEEFVPCPNDCVKQYVTVNLLDELTGANGLGGGNGDVGGPASSLRCATVAVSRDTTAVNISLSPNFTSRKRIEYAAVHEFGHILGFNHENLRADHDTFAIEAGSKVEPLDLTLTPYDPDSIMNYYGADANGSGSLSTGDIKGVQSFYAKNPDPDDDHDGIRDKVDNCPYASNRDQGNANFEAELVVARRSGFPLDDGHVPNASDTQAYIDRWQTMYRGDACDPTATTPALIENTPVSTSGDTCSVTSTALKTAASVTFDAYRGDAIGARRAFNDARGSSAICKCLLAGKDGDVLLCDSDPNAQCLVARDNAFPGGAVLSGYKRMTECGAANSPIDSVYTKLQAPVGVWGYVPASTPKQIWNALYDTTQLAALPNKLTAIVWSNANSPYPASTYSASRNPFTPDLRNHYVSVSTKPAFGGYNPSVSCPWCPPRFNFLAWRSFTKQPPMLLYGNTVTEGRIPLSQNDGSLDSASEQFAPSALAAFNIANGEIIMANDNVTSAIRGRANSTGVLVNGGTATVRGVFSVQADRRISYKSATGVADDFGVPPVRLFSALEGAGGGGSLISLQGSNLVIQDLNDAINGVLTRTITPLSNDIPSSPKAGAWDGPSRTMFVLDQTQPTATTRVLRLLKITSNGKSTQIWSSFAEPISTFPTAFYVQTTAQEEVFIAVSFAAKSEWAILNQAGVAKRTGTFAQALAAPPLMNDAMLIAPVAIAAGSQPAKGPFAFIKLSRAVMKLGSCSTAWLKNFLPSIDCGAAWNGVTPSVDAEMKCRNPR